MRLALAFFIVSITQDTSNVLESVQAMILLEYKSMILVRLNKSVYRPDISDIRAPNSIWNVLDETVHQGYFLIRC